MDFRHLQTLKDSKRKSLESTFEKRTFSLGGGKKGHERSEPHGDLPQQGTIVPFCNLVSGLLIVLNMALAMAWLLGQLGQDKSLYQISLESKLEVLYVADTSDLRNTCVCMSLAVSQGVCHCHFQKRGICQQFQVGMVWVVPFRGRGCSGYPLSDLSSNRHTSDRLSSRSTPSQKVLGALGFCFCICV